MKNFLKIIFLMATFSLPAHLHAVEMATLPEATVQLQDPKTCRSVEADQMQAKHVPTQDEIKKKQDQEAHGQQVQ